MTAINTAKVQRRSLSFNTIDDVLGEIDRIADADRADTLRTTGNWSAGQVFNHLAAWINYAYEGFPPGANPPWIIKVVFRLFLKKQFIRKGMKPGMRIPKTPDGTFGTERVSTEEGHRRLTAALMRLKNREPAKFDSPAMGPVSDEERIAGHLRHAELHLSFLHY